MKNILLTLFATLLISITVQGQDGEKVKWHSVNDLERLLTESPRPIFIDAYTDWCGWCKKLDSDTFSNPVIAKYLNDNFYPVKFDAESKEPVNFLGREFVNDGRSGRTHNLAVALLQIEGRISYPTVVFLNENGELLAPVPGYKGAKDFEPLIVYFAEKRYMTEKFDAFLASFKGKVE